MSGAVGDELEGVAGKSPGGREALRRLLQRYSVSARHLAPPGPTDEEIWQMAMAALRAPDHEKRMPFRFVIARGEGLARLAERFVDYGRSRGKTGAELDRERQKALQAPVLIAVIARINANDDIVPPHEQWMAVGGAVANAVNALHFMGYGAKMVAGARARDPAVVETYCREGEVLAGWIATGSLAEPPQPRGEIDAGAVISRY